MRTIWDIIEAIDDPSGLIHPEKHEAFAQGKHPLAKHPSYPQVQAGPEQRASNYEEVLASKQWQKILQKGNQYLGVPLTKQALPRIQQKMLGALALIDQVESAHKEELEALAVELVFELPEFKSAKRALMRPKRPEIEGGMEIEGEDQGSFQIDAQLTDDVDISDTLTSDEPAAQAPLHQERTPAEMAWMNKMIQRRHFTNAIIQGSAVTNNFLFELAGARLDRIHPELRKAYGIIMLSSELGYWMFPQDAVIAGAKLQTQVGTAEVTFVGDDGEEQEAGEEQPNEPGAPEEQPERPPARRIPVVKARAWMFPVLIQEIIKGLTELASLPSLPRDPVDRQEVLDKADLIDAEAWHMMLGPKLWDSFIEATDAVNERELTMHLYRHIQQLDVDEFNSFMKEVLAKSPRGMQMLRELATQIKGELDQGGDVQEAQLIVRNLID